MKPQARVLFGLVVFNSEKSGIVILMGSTRFLMVRSLICMKLKGEETSVF